MIIQLCNGFREIETFRSVRRIGDGMRRIAIYMDKNDLRDCNVYQLVKGQQSGKGWRIWKKLDTYFYRNNFSFKNSVRIGRMEELE